ncbi:hypothetical protein J2Z44_002661 [Clostridium punense]|uniref:AtpZ/AtpI family protein n=1 Tax=Clostridium punense TaxID=1054297 RepID=A0ABS4K6G1_9CLOT|nr:MULTISPECIES: hypothetical protein [Clostridium]EQB86188.1 hypothetical protein M918_15845 [Clostridium sp. BL8]MBP2022836.1 hypothetical protein [Clostridium punense]
MKIWQRRLIGISIVPIIWGVLVDLRFGKVSSFITRVIVVTSIGFLVGSVYEKIKSSITS